MIRERFWIKPKSYGESACRSRDSSISVRRRRNLHPANQIRQDSRTRRENIPGLPLVQRHSSSDALIGYRKYEDLINKIAWFPVAAVSCCHQLHIMGSEPR